MNKIQLTDKIDPEFLQGPGIFFIVPCIDSYKKLDLRTVSFDVPPQVSDLFLDTVEFLKPIIKSKNLKYLSLGNSEPGQCHCVCGCRGLL